MREIDMSSTNSHCAASSLGAAFLATALLLLAPASFAAEQMRVVPAYVAATDAPKSSPLVTETAVVAGGCFWGVQGVFQHVTGVTKALSGYAGGAASTAHYEVVSDGDTGHAEAVQVTFDPRVISYAQILQIYFSVGHDPTQLNRQGPDSGTQYRSAIFPANVQQAQIAKDYIAQINRARVFPAALVTKIEPGMAFYPAEDYHQDYLFHNPRQPYIAINDLPKIDGLKRIFPAVYRADPVLVKAK
ncbi:MAG: peptide-methionine (S)-S-oxide reductase MsrA [Pseudoxanthomonas sp.]